MNILLLGSGGRENAFAWKLKQSPLCEKLFIAPGNPGTAAFGENVNISATDFDALKVFVLANQVQMVVVGPEDPLVKGIFDFFANDEQLQSIPVIGPSKVAAQLEGSKAFAKRFMERHKIPTAGYREFNLENLEEGLRYIYQNSGPYVLKADGLAAGKGVLIIDDQQEAKEALREMIAESKFGKASDTVVIEQFLKGIEFSVFVMTDGTNYKLLPNAKDYKRIGEGDKGLNTGGMGAVSPVPFVTDELMERVERTIIQPTVNGLATEKIIYKGFIYVGLILVGKDPYVIEYNCRMGDPETEVVMPRLKSDLVELCVAIGNGTLNTKEVEIDSRAATTVILASGGYPEDFEKGKTISGLAEAAAMQDVLVFHAGTKREGDNIVTSGGRVLAITAYGVNGKEAVTTSLKACAQIQFEKKYNRSDIGYEFY
ncbi:MAG: phosphoribosylamine--glycine ligase [Chitinophagales bacterium]|nr:phosphoribosylamine--glycine ligase [Chitinophagales bacterium]